MLAALLALSSWACAPELAPDCHDETEPAEGPLELVTIPEAPLDAAPAILHLRARARAGPLDPAAMWLVEGDVGTGHLDQLMRDAPSQALQERFLPVARWADGDAVVLAPAVPLEPGGRYTVATAFEAALPFDVAADDPLPTLRAVWPPAGRSAGLPHGIWCGDAPLPSAAMELRLGPAGGPAHLTPGAMPDGRGVACVRIDIGVGDGSESHGPWAPPPLVSDGHQAPLARLEPTPLSIGADPIAIAPLPCTSQQTVVGPGCARVQDDRMWIHPPPMPLMWVFSDGLHLDLAIASSDKPFLVHPLPPASVIWLEVAVMDNAGASLASGASLVTAPAMPHLVITEVLANPIGVEPAQEWVEIYNDGLASAALSGWTFEDISGAVALPDAVLGPGQLALIVSDAYDPASEHDPSPPSGVLLLRVPVLGGNGLNNQGEPLTLRDPNGEIASRFPPLPKPKPGRSVMRIHPKASDDDPDAFTLSEENASTPGER